MAWHCSKQESNQVTVFQFERLHFMRSNTYNYISCLPQTELNGSISIHHPFGWVLFKRMEYSPSKNVKIPQNLGFYQEWFQFAHTVNFFVNILEKIITSQHSTLNHFEVKMACCDHKIVYYYFQWNKNNNIEDAGFTTLVVKIHSSMVY